MTREEFDLRCEQKFVDEMRKRIAYIHAGGPGDLAAFEEAISHAEARILDLQKDLKSRGYLP